MLTAGRGVLLALAAAVVHTCIDALRKMGSNQKALHPPLESLVFLAAILEAIVECTCVALAGGFTNLRFHNPQIFSTAVLASAALLLAGKVLYQKAISISQLSMTVPYLSFTPTFLVITAYVFVGEEPTTYGLLGVAIVTAGGYLLGRQDAAATKQGVASRIKSHKRTGSFGDLPLPLAADSDMSGDESGGTHADTLAAAQDSHSVLEGAGGSSSHPVIVIQDQLRRVPSTRIVQQPSGPQQHPLSAAPAGSTWTARAGFRTTHAGAAADVSDAATELASVAQPGRPHGSGSGGSHHKQHTLIIRASDGGRSCSIGMPPTCLPRRDSFQNLLSKHSTGSSSSGTAPVRSDRGIVLMVSVAAAWSVTASLDKLGCMHAPNVWVYLALQRLVIGIVSFVYLALNAPHTFQLLFTRHVRLLLAIAVFEMAAVVLFLEAIRHLFVSYVMAIKRSNILMSVVLGRVIFKERIAHKLPFICLMLAGMMLIVLDPQSSSVHTSGHT